MRSNLATVFKNFLNLNVLIFFGPLLIATTQNEQTNKKVKLTLKAQKKIVFWFSWVKYKIKSGNIYCVLMHHKKIVH